MLINAIYSDTVNILRREDQNTASRDVLNNIVYGDPTTWSIVYSSVKVRLSWTGKSITISNTGELVYPSGLMLYSTNLTLKPMDRVVTLSSPGIPTGIEYVIETVLPAYVMHGIVNHYVAQIHLPV